MPNKTSSSSSPIVVPELPVPNLPNSKPVIVTPQQTDKNMASGSVSNRSQLDVSNLRLELECDINQMNIHNVNVISSSSPIEINLAQNQINLEMAGVATPVQSIKKIGMEIVQETRDPAKSFISSDTKLKHNSGGEISSIHSGSSTIFHTPRVISSNSSFSSTSTVKPKNFNSNRIEISVHSRPESSTRLAIIDVTKQQLKSKESKITLPNSKSASSINESSSPINKSKVNETSNNNMDVSTSSINSNSNLNLMSVPLVHSASESISVSQMSNSQILNISTPSSDFSWAYDQFEIDIAKKIHQIYKNINAVFYCSNQLDKVDETAKKVAEKKVQELASQQQKAEIEGNNNDINLNPNLPFNHPDTISNNYLLEFGLNNEIVTEIRQWHDVFTGDLLLSQRKKHRSGESNSTGSRSLSSSSNSNSENTINFETSSSLNNSNPSPHVLKRTKLIESPGLMSSSSKYTNVTSGAFPSSPSLLNSTTRSSIMTLDNYENNNNNNNNNNLVFFNDNQISRPKPIFPSAEVRQSGESNEFIITSDPKDDNFQPLKISNRSSRPVSSFFRGQNSAGLNRRQSTTSIASAFQNQQHVYQTQNNNNHQNAHNNYNTRLPPSRKMNRREISKDNLKAGDHNSQYRLTKVLKDDEVENMLGQEGVPSSKSRFLKKPVRNEVPLHIIGTSERPILRLIWIFLFGHY